MDTRLLVSPEDIAIGDRIVEVLRSNDTIDLRAAMWWHDYQDSDELRLLLATPVYSSKGPLEAYRRINSALDAAQIRDVPVSRLWAVAAENDIVANLRTVVNESARHVSFENCVFNTFFVSFAYVYFIDKRRTGDKRKAGVRKK
jgi:hypothetical protein